MRVRLEGPKSETPAYAYPDPVYRYDLVDVDTGKDFHALLLTVGQAHDLGAQLERGDSPVFTAPPNVDDTEARMKSVRENFSRARGKRKGPDHG